MLSQKLFRLKNVITKLFISKNMRATTQFSILSYVILGILIE